MSSDLARVLEGLILEPGLREKPVSECLVDSRRQSPKELHGNVLLWNHHLQEGPVLCGLGTSQMQKPKQLDPQLLKLATGTWNVPSLVRKEP